MTNRTISFALALACFGLWGCSTTFVSVVQPLAEKPATFVVLPSDRNDDSVKFAGGVENALLRFGLQVVERPVFRFLDSGGTRTDSSGVGAYSGGPGGGVNVGQGTSVTHSSGIIDIVSMYDDTKAEIIVVAYWENYRGRIRIIRRKDRAVIGAANFVADVEYQSEIEKLYTALNAAGILKSPGMELRCDTMKVTDPTAPPESKSSGRRTR